MEKIDLHSYLMFEGNCREAMAFYQGIFGGNVDFMTFGDTDGSCPDAMKDKIMHATLMDGEIELMASDSPHGEPITGGKINLSLSGFDEVNLRKKFDRLIEGGNIVVPIAKQVWGDIFGSFRDKYGVDWMINIRQSTHPQG